jgi:hypothetical protein
MILQHLGECPPLPERRPRADFEASAPDRSGHATLNAAAAFAPPRPSKGKGHRCRLHAAAVSTSSGTVLR